MKRYLILILLLIASPSFAQWQEAKTSQGIVGAGAAGGASSQCTDATHDSGNNVISLCEDYDGAASCATSYSSTCRNTYTVIAGTPDFDNATALEGTYSLLADGTTTGITLSKSITAGDNYYIYSIVKTTTIGAANRSIWTFVNNVTPQCTVTLNAAGTLKIAHGTITATTSGTLSNGNTYYIWAGCNKGTGSDGVAYVAFSTTTTKPTVCTPGGTPCSDANSAKVDTGDTTLQIDKIYYAAGTGHSYTYDHFRVNTSDIGSNPP